MLDEDKLHAMLFFCYTVLYAPKCMHIRLFMKGLEKMGTDFGQKFTDMLPALESKKNEFHMYGYTTVTKEDIWVYCLRKKWRNKDVDSMRVHQIANDILQILP